MCSTARLRSDRDHLPRPLHRKPRVLVFHKVTTSFTFGSTNFAPWKLDELIARMTDAGYRFRSPPEIIDEIHQLRDGSFL